jgi:hypothetical protein
LRRSGVIVLAAPAEVLQQKIVAIRTVYKDFDRRRFGQALYRMPRTTRKLQGA